MSKARPNDPAAALDELIRLLPYDPRWGEAATKQMATLCRLLAGFDIQIEHVGSTAVAGMSAKPIIDLMVALQRPDDLEGVVEALLRAGWTDFSEAGVPGRRYLRLRGAQDLNLHLVASGSRHWRGALALRGYLRAHPNERAAYSEVKTRAVAAGCTSLLVYSDAKAHYVAALVERALAWAQGDKGHKDAP